MEVLMLLAFFAPVFASDPADAYDNLLRLTVYVAMHPMASTGCHYEDGFCRKFVLPAGTYLVNFNRREEALFIGSFPSEDCRPDCNVHIVDYRVDGVADKLVLGPDKSYTYWVPDPAMQRAYEDALATIVATLPAQ